METLQLKELSPYLPFGLKGLVTAERIGQKWEAEVTMTNAYNLIEHSSSNKPLLLPLEAILDQLADWLHSTQGESFDSPDNARGWLETVINHENPLNQFPYALCEKIFELHGDLFNLIPRGLAIDKRTVK